MTHETIPNLTDELRELLKQGKFTQATERYTQALQNKSIPDQKKAQALLCIGDAYRKRADNNYRETNKRYEMGYSVSARFESVRRDYDRSCEHLTAGLRLKEIDDNTRGALLCGLGETLFNTGRFFHRTCLYMGYRGTDGNFCDGRSQFAEAQKYCEAGLKLSGIDGNTKARFLNLRAREYRRFDRNPKAEAAWRQAVALSLDDTFKAELWDELGRHYYRQNKYEKMAAAYGRSLELMGSDADTIASDPLYPIRLYWKGTAEQLLDKQPDEAKRTLAFSDAVSKLPNLTNLDERRDLALILQKQHNEGQCPSLWRAKYTLVQAREASQGPSSESKTTSTDLLGLRTLAEKSLLSWIAINFLYEFYKGICELARRPGLISTITKTIGPFWSPLVSGADTTASITTDANSSKIHTQATR